MVMFSVIIPVYNVEEYLRECLESVISQNTENMEVILVDDGSSDGSSKICTEYALQHRFIQYIRKENAGLGAARNTGLLHAEGNYIIFLDSDDYWREDCIESLFECVTEYQYPDIVYFDSEIVCESEGIPRDEEYDARMYDRKGRVKEGLCRGTEFFFETYPEHFNVSACMAAYRRVFLEKAEIRFPEQVLYEDNLFSLKTVLKAECVRYLPKRLYVRRYRKSSIMTSGTDENSIREAAKIFHLVMDFAEMEKGKYEEIVFRKVMDFACMRAYALLQKCSEYNEMQDEINQIKNEVCNRVLTVFRKKERRCLYLEEYFLWSIIGQYLEDDRIRLEGKLGYIETAEKKLKELPFFHTDKRVGIYGRGNHTKELLLAAGRLGRISADLYVIDSNAASGIYDFEGLPVLNVRDVPEDTEAVVISSFLHEQEIYDMAVKNLPGQIKIIKMYQDEIRELCWRWLTDAG